jgi:hypothetical protein
MDSSLNPKVWQRNFPINRSPSTGFSLSFDLIAILYLGDQQHVVL